MPDIEKVIKGLTICKNPEGSCDGCEYFDNELGQDSCMRGHLMEDALDLLKEQKEQCNKLDYLFSKIAGHSDYHGDSILTAITCVKEGKEIGNVIPKDGD